MQKDSLGILVFIAVFISFPLTFASASETDCSLVKSAMHIASEIRGLEAKAKVPCKIQNKAEVESYLRETLEKKVPKQKLLNEEKLYKLIGFLPLSYDYQNGLIKLYTEQLGGYYDPDQDFYAMAGWMPEVVQMPIAVHELTHALQDQHYDLGKMMSQEDDFTDALLAKSAFVEGDATAVMIDFGRRGTGAAPLEKDKQVSGLVMQNLAGAMFSTGLHEAPPVLQAVLVFPYMSGLYFVHSLLTEGSYARVDKAYSKVPASTEQILHPEKYSKNEDQPRIIDEETIIKRFNLTPEQITYRDSFGEFMIISVLSSWLPKAQAQKAAAGWGGDKAVLLAPSPEQGAMGAAIWWLVWDSEADAEEFFTSISSAYEKRFAKTAVKEGDRLAVTSSELGLIEVTKEGEAVIVSIGMKNK